LLSTSLGKAEVLSAPATQYVPYCVDVQVECLGYLAKRPIGLPVVAEAAMTKGYYAVS